MASGREFCAFHWQRIGTANRSVAVPWGGRLSVVSYRGIGTDYEDGAFGYDVISHGILLGFEYKF